MVFVYILCCSSAAALRVASESLMQYFHWSLTVVHIPVRLYPSWMARVLDIEAPNMELYEPTEDIEKIVIDILVQLLNLGMYIHKNQKVSCR
jgi:hypothetical protein